MWTINACFMMLRGLILLNEKKNSNGEEKDKLVFLIIHIFVGTYFTKRLNKSISQVGY